MLLILISKKNIKMAKNLLIGKANQQKRKNIISNRGNFYFALRNHLQRLQ